MNAKRPRIAALTGVPARSGRSTHGKTNGLPSDGGTAAPETATAPGGLGMTGPEGPVPTEVAPPSRPSLQSLRRRSLSLLSLVALWWVLSLFFNESVLPGPREVGASLWDNLQDGATYFHLYKTVLRVVAGMAIAVIVGLMIGLIMGLSKFGEQFLDSWVMVAFTVPSVVYGILAILWFGLNDFAAILAIGVTAIPAVAINIWQGVKAIDISLVHMGKAFHFSRASILRKIVIPQLVPYILAALRYALGTAWKIATVVELIGLSSGVGYQLHYWFGLFNMTQVLAWTIAFTVVLLLIEYVILKPIEVYLTRWRPSVQG